jgi:anaerobic ribonucleoside-triphosphate reductase activating protein
MTLIAISRLHFPVTTLGPGNRIGIWLQGCSIRCPGCISADTWAFGKGIVDLEQVLKRIGSWLPQADGITISGGEPFDQPDALRVLLHSLRRRTCADILVFTGYTFEELAPLLAPFSGLLDALITGPFLRDQPQTFPLRGSDNQQLHLLTPLGERRFASYIKPTNHRPAFDVMFDDDGTVWLAGIPLRDDFRRIKATLEEHGHRLLTTEDRSVSLPLTEPK